MKNRQECLYHTGEGPVSPSSREDASSCDSHGAAVARADAPRISASSASHAVPAPSVSLLDSCRSSSCGLSSPPLRQARRRRKSPAGNHGFLKNVTPFDESASEKFRRAQSFNSGLSRVSEEPPWTDPHARWCGTGGWLSQSVTGTRFGLCC
jgi:hypothetical protein